MASRFSKARFSRLDSGDQALAAHRSSRSLPFSRNPFEAPTNRKVLGDRRSSSDVRSRALHLRSSSHDGDEEEGEELADGPWTEGLTDLFFVAALSSFNKTHQLAQKVQLASYTGFFVVIWWVWTSQILYDVRYQTSDIFHRLVKVAQLLIFSTFAAYSGYLELSYGIAANGADLDGLSHDEELSRKIQDAAEGSQKKKSLQAFALTYIVSRGLLSIQYARLWFYLRKARVQGTVSQKTVTIPILVSLVSAALWAAGYGLLTTTTSRKWAIVRLILWYSGILLELLGGLYETQLEGFVRYRRTNLGERVGLLSLIIIGEGVIGLVEVAQSVTNGVGFTPITYIQVLASFLVAYCIWAVYFDGFGRRLETGRLRSLLWTYEHFILQLSIVFIFAGIRGSLAITEATFSTEYFLDKTIDSLISIFDLSGPLNTSQLTQDNITLAGDLSRFVIHTFSLCIHVLWSLPP
ncbi:hypothetical protein BT69DRAFT_1345062, partial [Atractiella rhizophila]